MAAIAGFFALATLSWHMSTLRDALGDLPDPVFADLHESEGAYLLVVDLPGVSSDTLDVRAEGPRLTIEARREKEVPAAFRYRREDRPLFVDVELPLPPEVAGDEAEGTLERGALALRLPKRTEAGTTIPIATDADGTGSTAGQ